VRSTIARFEAFCLVLCIVFLEGVICSGEAIDSRRWLPFEFFCWWLDFRRLMISFAFSSCLAMDFSRLEILKLVLAVSFWFDSRLFVALAIA